jgi:hypothetical protein
MIYKIRILQSVLEIVLSIVSSVAVCIQSVYCFHCFTDPRELVNKMARVDSGHETLFSDDSPCDLVTTPSACSSSGLGSASSGNHNQHSSEDADSSRLAPPKITPYSGVLGKASHSAQTVCINCRLLLFLLFADYNHHKSE